MAAIGEFVHWVGLPIQLLSKKNQNFCLDRSGVGGVVKIWTWHKGHQNESFSVDADGRIHCIDNPDWVVDAGTNNANGANIRTIQLSKNSNIANTNRVKWKLHTDGRIESLAYPGKVMDIWQASMKDGSYVVLHSYNGGNNQQWIPVQVDKYYDGTNFEYLYSNATKKSSLSLSEFARAWNAPFIMELSINSYDTCLETPYETFSSPSKGYDIAFCVLIILFVIFAGLLIYDYKRSRDTDNNISIDNVYVDDRLE